MDILKKLSKYFIITLAIYVCMLFLLCLLINSTKSNTMCLMSWKQTRL